MQISIECEIHGLQRKIKYSNCEHSICLKCFEKYCFDDIPEEMVIEIMTEMKSMGMIPKEGDYEMMNIFYKEAKIESKICPFCKNK